ncbi:hypothetical protein K3723_14005 [Leisingera caerulea]|uniref:hypothetical protein n=1 Tax=Leisingera caerulea TaxID=506591 RepID=UPI0021A33A19|nr:hypothetical protein [Leisingera caerulea]UWQ61960.1 hypothetical protein K3723_14005 [Leisingera caerulea]
MKLALPLPGGGLSIATFGEITAATNSTPAMKGPNGLEAAQSIGALIVVLHQRQLAERARVVDSFHAFNSMQTQERFRALFHGKKAK